MLESTYQKKLKKKLDKIDGLYCFVKEAGAIRGIPDIIGVYRGVFFALEVKKDKGGVGQKTGRVALQRYVMLMIKNAGGFAEFIYPEIEEQVLSALESVTEPYRDML